MYVLNFLWNFFFLFATEFRSQRHLILSLRGLVYHFSQHTPFEAILSFMPSSAYGICSRRQGERLGPENDTLRASMVALLLAMIDILDPEHEFGEGAPDHEDEDNAEEHDEQIDGSMLKSQKAVISGSIVLYPMISTNFSGTNSNSDHWLPSDMDIYMNNTRSPLIDYMIQIEGFKLCGEKIRGRDEQYIAPCGIHRVHCLHKQNLSVDVITSTSQSAIMPILHFHSTVVMNWISQDGIFSAYPKLTCSHHGLINPLSFTQNQFVPALPAAGARSALKKYFKRGFDIRRNPNCWPGDSHTCSISPSCPIMARNIIDRGTMFISFIDDSNGDSKIFIDKPGILPYDHLFILFWYFGGPACTGLQRVCDPFIAQRPNVHDEHYFR